MSDSTKNLSLKKLLKNKLLNLVPIDEIFKQLQKSYAHPIDILIKLIHQELYHLDKVDLALKHRLRAYLNGFTSRLYRIYELKNRNDLNPYLSSFARRAYTRYINQDIEILKNKQKFYEYMFERDMQDYLPGLLGVVKTGNFKGEQNIKNHLLDKKKIVLRPCIGSGGLGVYICELDEEHVIINGQRKKLREFELLIQTLDGKYIITDFCEQANFFREIYPFSANTIRIWTMNPENKEPFIPVAVLRIGTKKSGFLDNVSRGGLTAPINLETGEVGKGAQLTPFGEVRWYKNHPDTSTQIEGFTIPHWNSIKKELLSLVSKLPECKYVGWDLLLKDNEGDFVIIEGNHRPDIDLVQVHNPLLEDQRVINFYRENGVPV